MHADFNLHFALILVAFIVACCATFNMPSRLVLLPLSFALFLLTLLLT